MRRYTLNNRICSLVMAVLLVLALLMPMIPAVSAAESGSCGRDLEWSFADGTLTITGKGAMDDYASSGDAPWYSLREQIFRLELPKGLTHVGKLAFYGCSSITAVTIPQKVRTIGDMAFMHCSGMEILRLPEGLESIGENAFEQCASLRDLRLPGTLKILKDQAFYRCSSLRSVVVPRSVTEMGKGVFSYCDGLIQAAVHAPLRRLPTWTFYGCTSLTSIDLADEIKGIGPYSVYSCEALQVIYYGGEPGDAEELKAQISEDNAFFDRYGSVKEEKPEESETSTNITTDENDDVIVEESTVTQTDESTITVTDKENITDPDAEDPSTEISATVVEKEGWEQVEEQVKEALKDSDSVEVEIFVTTDTKIPDSMVENLAGKNVVITIINPDGTKYTLDFSQIDKSVRINGLDLSYRLETLDKTYEALGGATGFRLKFSKSCSINAQIMIQLPIQYARRNVTLYQLEGGKPQLLQSVVADAGAVAHFYLASVDKNTDYILGIDVPGVTISDLLIPDSMDTEYGITERLGNVEYVVTGRYSKWGLTSIQVTQLLIGFMLSTAAFVGLAMYARNKRKIRQGYIPGWDDTDDDEI